MPSPYAAAILTAVLAFGGAACGSPEEVLGDAVNAAGCAAAEQAVSPIKDGARAAAEELGVDPAGARRELEVLKAAVDGAAATVSGETRAALQEVSRDLGSLVDQARAAARGAVDQQEVDRVQGELGTAVDDVLQIC